MIKQLEQSVRTSSEEHVLHQRMKRLEAYRLAKRAVVLDAEANARLQVRKLGVGFVGTESGSASASYASNGRLGSFRDPGYAFDTEHRGYALHEAMNKMVRSEGLDAPACSDRVGVGNLDPLSERALQANAAKQHFVRRRQRIRGLQPIRSQEEVALIEFVMGNPELEVMATMRSRCEQLEGVTFNDCTNSDEQADQDAEKQVAWIMNTQVPSRSIPLPRSASMVRVPAVSANARQDAFSVHDPARAQFEPPVPKTDSVT